jgi:hypothetical protein
MDPVRYRRIPTKCGRIKATVLTSVVCIDISVLDDGGLRAMRVSLPEYFVNYAGIRSTIILNEIQQGACRAQVQDARGLLWSPLSESHEPSPDVCGVALLGTAKTRFVNAGEFLLNSSRGFCG